MALLIVNAHPGLFKITMMFPVKHVPHAWIMMNAATENMIATQTDFARILLVLMHVNVKLDSPVMVMNVSILTSALEIVINATLLPIAWTQRSVKRVCTKVTATFVLRIIHPLCKQLKKTT